MSTTRKRKTSSEDWEEPDHEEFELAEFIETVGPTIARVYIYRIPKYGDHEYLERTTVDVLAGGVEEYLRETYGAGKYQLRFRGSDHRWKLQKIVNIGSMEKDAKPTLPASIAGNGADSGHVQFMREQLAQQQTLVTALIQGLAGRPAPDPSAMLTAVVAAFSAIRGNGDGDPKEDWVGKAKTIIELARDLQPGSPGSEENVWSVVKDIGRQITSSLPAAGTPPAASPPVAVPPVASATSAISSPEQQEKNMADWIRIGLGYLKHKAAIGKDPDIYVDWILDNDDEPQCIALANAVQQGATLDHLLQFDPEIAPYVEWFRKLHTGLVADLQTPVDTARPGGNTDHAVDDAGSRAEGSAGTGGAASSRKAGKSGGR